MSVSAFEKPRSGYIVGPSFDWVFFLAPPTLALAVGILISGTSFADSEFEIWGHETSWSGFLIGILIHAHVVIVFFRSHGNPGIFKQYPGRFLAVPILLYLAMYFSEWALISVAVLATFWDVYHSGMQTFGFGRIYDARAGNSPTQARTLDLILNQLLYAGPIVGGAYEELRGDSYVKQGKTEEARNAYNQALTHAGTSRGDQSILEMKIGNLGQLNP